MIQKMNPTIYAAIEDYKKGKILPEFIGKDNLKVPPVQFLIVKMICSGLLEKQVAAMLHTSHYNIKAHVQAFYGRHGFCSHAAMFHWAFYNNVIIPGEFVD